MRSTWLRSSLALVLLSACNPPVAPDAGDAGTDAGTVSDVQTADTGAPDANTQSVAIEFAPRVGTQAFRCDDEYMLGTPATRAKVADFRFYVHDVRLLKSDGAEVALTLDTNGFQSSNVALVDFENRTGSCDQGDAETNTVVRGTVPTGTYTGVKFRVGVPFALNHGDLSSQPSPLNRSTLFWSWRSGHLFFAATSRTVDATVATDAGLVSQENYTHLGSTECDGNPAAGTPVTSCAKANRPEYTFAAFNPATQRIAVDFAAVKQGSDISATGGCHSVQPTTCTTPFANLGVDFATGASTATQSVFRVE